MPQITIDARTFLRGASISDELSDGGFSPLSKGINLYAKPGLLLPGPAPFDSGSAVSTGGIFAWATTASNVAPGITKGVGSDAANHGRFYALDDSGGATLVASDATRIYKAQITDMIRYGSANEFFVTSATDVAKLNFDMSVQDFTWWTVTRGHAALGADKPHKIIQLDTILYITDGRYVHAWDGTTSTPQVLVLPENYIIQDATIYNNLIYISAARYDPSGGGEASDCRIFTWKGLGVSAHFQDEFILQENVESLILFGGTLIVTTRSYVGYWTGSTISPLYPLTSSVYKHQYAITLDRLYLLQGADILCYGNPAISHPKFFSYPLKYGSTLIGIVSTRRGKIIFARASGSGAYTDVNGFSQTGNTFLSNKVFLGSRGDVSQVIIESEPLTSGADISLGFYDSNGVLNAVPASGYTFAARGGVSFFNFTSIKLNVTLLVQLAITWNAVPKGVRRVQIVYGHTEYKGNG